MALKFIKQQIAESISTGDKIELYNCDDHQLNGTYIVADVEPETGDVTLVGTGDKGGYVTVINMGGEE